MGSPSERKGWDGGKNKIKKNEKKIKIEKQSTNIIASQPSNERGPTATMTAHAENLRLS